jgi:NAD-dependent deacetylase
MWKIVDVYLQIANLIQNSTKITVVSGAGISVASGIPDFRSQNGLYRGNKEDIPYYLSLSYFQKEPEKFWSFYKDLLQIKLQDSYHPNEGHYFLAELERMGKKVTIVTQNVDGLHQKAGSSHVIEIHGNAQRSTCPTCGKIYDLTYINHHPVPTCERDNTVIKPGMVLYEESIQGFAEAYNATCEADVFIALGTCLQVSPVNQLPTYIQHSPDIAKIIINKEQTSMDYLFQYRIVDDINSCFSKLKEYL